jgi:SAM-dependent methyltransferase
VAPDESSLAVQRAAGLVRRFLDDRGDRTRQAYTTDLEDFARFTGGDVASAVARLLADGPDHARRLVLQFTVDLRRRSMAPATIERRRATLRALARVACDGDLVDWALELPGPDEVSAALEARVTAFVPYLLPHHPSEVDRLDVQHYALREVLGANHLHMSPIQTPARVLDVGSGTGQWSFELCERFPEALSVGLDLVPSKRERPARYRWVRANLLEGLPFADDVFDFVHQRLLAVAVPLARWPDTVAEVVRVTRPGGWVELVEPIVRVQGGGPASDRFSDLVMKVAEGRGLDNDRSVFDALDGHLRRAGLLDVTRREVTVPTGPWGGRVGSFMATDLRAVQMRMSEVLQARSLASAEECRDLVARSQEECQHRRMFAQFAFAFGRKPEPRRPRPAPQ